MKSRIKSFAKFSISNNSDASGNAILLTTDNFRVIIPRDKQTVPGVLRLEVTKPHLNDWLAWGDEDWAELIKTQRVIEFLLIEAFEKDRDPKLKPTSDKKLVNLLGKQRRNGQECRIYFDIAPRYGEKEEIIILTESEKHSFYDELSGKPFDFSKSVVLSDIIYNKIVNMLRTTLSQIDFSKFNLKDDFSKKWSECFNCKHPKEHPEQAGLVEAQSETGLTFAMSLDSRSQEEKGRAFLDPFLHIPALRYWDDELMPTVGKAFQSYISTVNDCYKVDTGREFDFAILMNLARPPAGTHTHFHFIPRTPGGKNYGYDFLMDTKTYLPLTKDSQERKKIVSDFSDKLCTNLNKKKTLSLFWRADSAAVKEVKYDDSMRQPTKFKSQF